jgi:hypothetical protein
MYKKYLIYFPVSLLFVVSCSQNEVSETLIDIERTSENGQDSTTTDTKALTLNYDSTHNALGNFLGAKEDFNSNELYYQYTQSNAYSEFKNTMDDIWKKVDQKKETMQTWAKSELAQVHENTGTLFYPFSGADLLHADLFFPNFDTILFFALEPVGSIPELSTLNENENLDAYLKSLNKSLQDILNLSFFRTKAMQVQLKRDVDGTLPLFLHFIARTNHELLSIEPITLTSGGQIIPIANKASDYPMGYQFNIKNKVSEKKRTLYYFSCNFQNTSFTLSSSDPLMPGLTNDSIILPFLMKQNIKATYLKSASYLLHRSTFSIMRKFILDYSTYIIQDDSGIPFKYFDESLWNITLFGSYNTPIPLFAERFEEELHAAYRDGKIAVKELPFGIGYKSIAGRSNMLFAIKKHVNLKD